MPLSLQTTFPLIQKDPKMQYKTVILELLQHHSEVHEQLRNQRMLLTMVDHYSSELKTRHEAWKQSLSHAKPGSNPSQIASEALEIALKELEVRLTSGSPLLGSEPLTLDAAMAFVRAHTPSAQRR
jgi:hypothetical protein